MPKKNLLTRAITHTTSTLSSRLEKNIHRQFALPMGKLSPEILGKMSIPELYQTLEDIIARDTDLPTLLADTARGQAIFLHELSTAIAHVRQQTHNHLAANQVIKAHEGSFLFRLKLAGLDIDYKSELSHEEIAAQPNLILSTHQGGGWENYMAQGLTGILSGIVVKEQLLKYPFINEGLKAKKAIAVNREAVNDPARRQASIQALAHEITERLRARENMLVFFEGTRSRDGEIAATTKRRAWAKDLLTAIDAEWEKTNWHDGPRNFQKLLLVVHTMGTMPDTPEYDFFLSRFRLNTPLAARLVKADHLWVEESDDKYDPNTLFGKARGILKKMLVEIILRY